MRRACALFGAMVLAAVATLFGAPPALAQGGCGQISTDSTEAKLLEPHMESIAGHITKLKANGVDARVIALRTSAANSTIDVVKAYIAKCADWRDGNEQEEDNLFVVVWSASINGDSTQRRICLYSSKGVSGIDKSTLVEISESITPTVLQYSPTDETSWHFVADGINQALEQANNEVESSQNWNTFWKILIAVIVIVVVVVAIIAIVRVSGRSRGGSSGGGYYYGSTMFGDSSSSDNGGSSDSGGAC